MQRSFKIKNFKKNLYRFKNQYKNKTKAISQWKLKWYLNSF